MMKRLFVTFLSVFCLALTTEAQLKIDFNMSGRSEAEGLEPGYTAWAIGRETSAQASFEQADGSTMTIKLSAVPGLAGNAICTKYWKQGVVNYGYKLLADACLSIELLEPGVSNDYVDVTQGASGIRLEVSGLAAGEHSLMAYHNAVDGWTAGLPPVMVKVNGSVVAENIPQTCRAVRQSDSGYSYITFKCAEGETVTIDYISVPQAGSTYSATAVTINALVFDESNPLTQAFNPYPANNDRHADADNGQITLRWSPAPVAVKHHVMIGTEPGVLKEQAIQTDTTYIFKDLNTIDTYYWRIDEEDAAGRIHKGEEWNFRKRQLAFPGAEGYGKYATGGRGGIVYHVTNLNHDHNPGSLLYGLVDLKGPRTIVFDVAGMIDMGFEAVFVNPYATIAAQTAPGKGICIRRSNLNIGSETICRFLRAKHGYGDTGNALGITGADHSIIDHTTAAWGTDETFSSRGAKNITFQNSMIAEALGIADHKNYASGKNHGFAATIGGSIGTFSHNLLVNCNGRNWSMGGGLDGEGKAAGELDMFNNVCYNWHGRTTDGGARLMQFVNNYYKMGPDTENPVLFTAQNELGGHRAQFAYVSGNLRINKDGSVTKDQKNVTYNATGDYPEETWYDVPFFPSEATIHSANDAYKIVTSDAGATMPCRDEQHLRLIKETIEGSWTYKGSRSGIRGEIDHEDDCGGWEAYPEETRPADYDTDQDGMPDWYERICGSDPGVADNNSDPDNDGWTLLEDYLEFMANPYIVLKSGENGSMNLTEHFKGFTKTPVFAIEIVDGGDCLKASVDGNTLNITTSEANGMAVMKATVTDGDGTVYSRRISVAVTDGTTGISQATDDFDNADIVRREFFTVDGKSVVTMKKGEVYIMKATTSEGEVKTFKVIKN